MTTDPDSYGDQPPEIIVYEALLRRAARLPQPVLLKGSYLTRQYFASPADRRPNDLDWLYLEPQPDAATAAATFTAWLTQVTELDENDGVRFRSFRENAFWRMMDYAMADDFPTVNTDLGYWLDDAEVMEEISLDISFNLPLSVPSVPLLYTPVRGLPFVVPHTAPLALQVSWKMHQSLVRPRFKDLFDLLHLLQQADFTADTRREALQALAEECRADGTDLGRAHWLIRAELEPLFPVPGVAAFWAYWRHGERGHHQFWDAAQAAHITDPTTLPDNLAEFQAQLQRAFELTGFAPALAALVGAPSPLAALVGKAAGLRASTAGALDQAADHHWNLLDRISSFFNRK